MNGTRKSKPIIPLPSPALRNCHSASPNAGGDLGALGCRFQYHKRVVRAVTWRSRGFPVLKIQHILSHAKSLIQHPVYFTNEFKITGATCFCMRMQRNMSIASLPLELLTRICEYLEPQDWGALRITCRQIHGNTLEAYTTRYSKRISLILTREGLDCLEQIAASKTIRGSVKEIWIIPNLFEGWTHLDKESLTNMYTSENYRRFGLRVPKNIEMNQMQAELDALFTVFEATRTEHRAILECSGLFSTLQRCLPRLENAVTLGLRCRLTNVFFDHAKPSSDTKHASFTCLGLRAFKSRFKFKQSPRVYERIPYLPFDLAFSRLLHAIIECSRKVQALYTCGQFSCGMKLNSFQLPESQYQLMLPFLTDLTTLHLCIRLKDHEQKTFNEDTFKHLLNVLATVAPTLKTLTFAQWSPIEELSPLYFKDLSQRIRFSQLEELHLHSIEVTVKSLEEFLWTAAPTLKRLSLRLISLVDGITSAPDLGPLTQNESSWIPLLSTQVKNEMQGLWKRIFEFLTDHLKLQYVRLSMLGYRGRDIMLQDHLYTERGQPDAQPSPVLNPSGFYFDAERASIPFKEWITQLQIEM
ncbi:hypothetical protein N7495_009075 [Penicillium taxi]|uniref:uncharacterized protein n=1 Tax=Penicillium taxi TaxID=168475 RepID=UPI002544D8F4|nr:uncharacterized protein N7495_009075 [Penicillium taxi]KAJ5889034.1 hypothetical protein N7495_009075 [Penicillium taxi]